MAAPICQRDLSSGLQQPAVPLRNAMLGSPCIDGTLADTDPATPGPQYSCEVVSATDRGTPAEIDTALPRCTPEDATATNPRCWRLALDPATCASSDHRRLAIEGAAALSPGAHVIAKCTILAPP